MKMSRSCPIGFRLSACGTLLLADKGYLRTKKQNGYMWAYSENGAHFFQKCLDERWKNKFALMRCLPEDLENGNFEFFAAKGLSNTNPA
jgi:hypothetical protein